MICSRYVSLDIIRLQKYRALEIMHYYCPLSGDNETFFVFVTLIQKYKIKIFKRHEKLLFPVIKSYKHVKKNRGVYVPSQVYVHFSMEMYNIWLFAQIVFYFPYVSKVNLHSWRRWNFTFNYSDNRILCWRGVTNYTNILRQCFHCVLSLCWLTRLSGFWIAAYTYGLLKKSINCGDLRVMRDYSCSSIFSILFRLEFVNRMLLFCLIYALSSTTFIVAPDVTDS